MTVAAQQSGPIRIGQYEIVRRLRSGGMATVFLARRRGPAGFSRDVVLKLVHPHLMQENQFIAMFMDEARISARINHANVVHVEEFGEEDGVFFLVMEHVEGCALNQLLRELRRRRERLPVATAVHIAARAAAGLHAAHETRDESGGLLGIVHRDVSPSNILVARDGQVKIIDFGVAKARGRSTLTAASSALKGKVRYMSPEQAWGSGIDRRSDVYALAVVLWEMLTGRPLFVAGNEMALLEMVRRPEVPPASTYNAEVSDALDRVIAQATAVNADDRPPTAADLRALLTAAVPEALNVDPEGLGALAAGVSGEEAGAVPATPTHHLEQHSATTPDQPTHQPVRASGTSGRRGLLIAIAAIALVAGLAGLAIALWPSTGIPLEDSPEPEVAAPPPAATTAPAAAPSPPDAAPAGKVVDEPAVADQPRPQPKTGRRSSRAAGKSKSSPPAAERRKPKPKRVDDTPLAEEFEE